MKIAVDAMGGDYAPKEIVEGIELARDAYPDIEFLLFGLTDQIQKYLKDDTRIEVKQADEVIEMGDEPVKAVRTKKQSSMVLAATSVKEGQADAFFSAGNTGAILASGLFIIGRIKGIDRPGLATTLPVITKDDQKNFVMLDVGANADTKVLNMYQYALMGKYYASNVMKVNNPRVGLLNNGTEADKGDMDHRKVHDLLADDSDIHFIGNVESRELLNGAADVVVTDGFTGNAVLKSIEGTALSMLHLIKGSIMSGGMTSKLGAAMLKGTFGQIAKSMDYSQYGGAVLMGVKAPVVKTHGSSKAPTVKNTIGQIKQMIDSKMISDLNNYLNSHTDQLQEIKETIKNSK
ncbi:phosphate acyltransferase PlsX [Lentilactobacillus hilgardii]|uniref:Phosphate acyltransferase n=1 Tax=Lentilactobacillus hilgardii (strain ATCC 8290 / DSM 20176 / CCUG 30140 / JCM 1155 / KCTC 3500 / NBRC 15886 / NCIMB 8040 / NRRL B-1843 / 9) TaxID=1423757 RepID=C0XM54_LENH9|nr:phosphate acyltransferase PlsX [Lentilactobacillus hilgardii]EEI23593.1 fatty acid/phospholipid synthesis protein PlsX [Lentilactobacillus hilgardii DSM 20176 = ATCC 8290]KRK56980.1 fatty acid phospholipid synthesis protein PlsX [Lentilactobacillus hilgardii DSM 20176 = ATCC 8290]MCP9332067.1 phosphate acyltransferase PlsX [Lentilactobacillus hilgardii]MCP9348634.1 phosphate acyltransferase PlsX [Lentilactobacillus hilgardii]MCP9351538.1 phosphate acyltransferase PlsX [Lentilactobacillus hi